ncbi:MAG: hypothetical protein NXI20_03560 [bacterium]|nr:hypothetical protein [bacterium]
MKIFKNYLLLGLLGFGLLLTGCGDDEAPEEENEEEVIDLVTLTFTPAGGGTAIVAEANDPDGEGAQDFTLDDINLAANTTYTLALELENTEEGESITEEIEEEDAEHMFFFSFTADAFSDPAGNGNIDSRGDDVNYNDLDGGGLPVGLSTTWTTGDATSGGTFRVVLKHQPDIKTATSTATDGESDIDLTFTLNIQ